MLLRPHARQLRQMHSAHVVALTVNPHVANNGRFPCGYSNEIWSWRQRPWGMIQPQTETEAPKPLKMRHDNVVAHNGQHTPGFVAQ
jgi:hypothetical protein